MLKWAHDQKGMTREIGVNTATHPALPENVVVNWIACLRNSIRYINI